MYNIFQDVAQNNKMSKYIQLAKVNSNYAKRMNRLSRQIFGEVVRETNPKSMKVVKLFSEQPMNKKPEIIAYYPRYIEIGKLMLRLREYGLFRDEHQDFKEEMKRLRTLRGKPPRPPQRKQKEDAR